MSSASGRVRCPVSKVPRWSWKFLPWILRTLSTRLLLSSGVHCVTSDLVSSVLKMGEHGVLNKVLLLLWENGFNGMDPECCIDCRTMTSSACDMTSARSANHILLYKLTLRTTTNSAPQTLTTTMAHVLPPLPYPYNSLEPYISEEIMVLHHTKHHQTYVNALNAAEAAYEKASTPRERIALQAALKFNGGGAWSLIDSSIIPSDADNFFLTTVRSHQSLFVLEKSRPVVHPGQRTWWRFEGWEVQGGDRLYL